MIKQTALFHFVSLFHSILASGLTSFWFFLVVVVASFDQHIGIHMSQKMENKTRGETNGSDFPDTAYTKIFVGGLAWETKKDSLECYFEQFGEILEAVVIIDRSTGRSKGYGFVSYYSLFTLKRFYMCGMMYT